MNGFDAKTVREFFELFARLLKPGGTLSYFEYIGVRTAKMPFAGEAERRRLRRVGALVRRMQRRYQYKCRRVLSNFPPAYARHLRFDGGQGTDGNRTEEVCT
ncbi:MAG: hypothetical protein N3A38_12070 [Planctomycetota bacterium]|nr:hypothetical protein [Planctomycetota bacterium]